MCCLPGTFLQNMFLKKMQEGSGVDEKGYDLKTGKVLVEVNPRYFRPTEAEILLGDPPKAEKLYKSTNNLKNLTSQTDKQRHWTYVIPIYGNKNATSNCRRIMKVGGKNSEVCTCLQIRLEQICIFWRAILVHQKGYVYKGQPDAVNFNNYRRYRHRAGLDLLRVEGECRFLRASQRKTGVYTLIQ